MPGKRSLGLAVVTAIVAAGCGSQADQAQKTGKVGVPEGGTVSTVTMNPAAGYPEAKTGQGRRLGPHSVRAPRNAADNEGPDKPTPMKYVTWSYRVKLAGRHMSDGSSVSSTAATVRLRNSKVCWNFSKVPSVSASSAALGRLHADLTAMQATINIGTRGKTGPVLVPLGVHFSTAGCTHVARVVVNTIAAAPHLYYLRLAGQRFSSVAIRAQL
ncbi:MAG: hypothetical protein ACXVR1_03435 [Solirubrobacteraceae bacterium]